MKIIIEIKKVIIPIFLIVLSLIVLVALSGCGSSSQILFKYGGRGREYVPESYQVVNLNECENFSLYNSSPRLKPGDRISVSFLQNNNIHDGAVLGSQGGGAVSNWHTLSRKGIVVLPLMGEVILADCTVMAAQTYINTLFSAHYHNPIVELKAANSIVSILGEVGSQGQYSLENDFVSLPELIAKASGLTDWGKGDCIKIIRNTPSDSIVFLCDISTISPEKINKFYLRDGDIVYIEPRQLKLQEKSILTITSIITAISASLFVFLQFLPNPEP